MDSGGIYTSRGSSMLGLEMSLNPNHIQLQQPIPPNPHILGDFACEIDQSQQSVKQQGFQQYSSKPKNQSNLTFSDDDHDDHGGHTTENSADYGKRKMSPWQRMKWTDNMVRLLIMVVYYIGDNESGPELNDSSGKKKGSGVLQKKGKWKSVSRAMMERGFYVSPQQCEDKFNDLNKRYKRVNDIIGKGTACKVVENQALLETMDHISPKMKDEVKKLLNSKHLFFREMCAYHNSCGHGGVATSSVAGIGSGGGVQRSPDVCGEPSQAQQQLQQQRCLHSSGHASMGPNFGRSEADPPNMAKGVSLDEDDDDGDDSDDDDDEDEDVVEGRVRSHDHDSDNDDRSSRKRRKKGVDAMSSSPSIQQFSSELMNVLQDGSKTPTEKKEWMKMRMVQLEEQHFSYQSQAFELQKQKLKWEKFCCNKEREMARERLANERMKLENERMALLIRQKELELIDLQHQHSKSDPSIITG
ncbi:hypothetical protein Leryth_017542 [Lithospermum erythrorhizon]|nr:hypothetical protein Leryth_017542 [Lithospermum erythrorhizon]